MQSPTKLVPLLLWLLLICTAARAQLSSNAQISVITCGPGDELYSTFGHSAFRVQDPGNGLDLVYNYGTFDFNTPNFYMKFARGKLLYSLSRQAFGDFLYAYQLENRWVKEQLLQLTVSERNELFRFLETNYEPANREYQYDFLFNNCSTKIPEVLKAALGPGLHFQEDHLEKQYTFRQLIRQYLDANSWSSLGIDLALGAVIDRKAGVLEHMFLPDYVYGQLKHTLLNDRPLVGRERNILPPAARENISYFTLTPAFWLMLFLLFTLTITYIDFRNGSRSRALDFILFAGTGLLGLMIVFLWFFTDHTATIWNLNILWAVPLNPYLAILLLRRYPFPGWLSRSMLILLVLLGFVPLLWLFGIQVFSPWLWLIWASLLLRYAFLYRHFKTQLPPGK